MLKRLVGSIRRWNRERLERRQLVKANAQQARGFFGRLVHRLSEQNHARLARRRAHREILASLAANDTAVLEALAYLLRSARDAEKARIAAADALESRLRAVEDRLGDGFHLVAARLATLEGRALPAATNDALAEVARPGLRPAPASKPNGEASRASDEGARRGEAGSGGDPARTSPFRRV